MRALSGLWRLQIRAVPEAERPAWGVPGTHVSGIGYNQYAHLGSKKAARPRVRPATTRAAARTPTTAKRDPPARQSRPDRRPHAVPQKHSLVQRNDQYSRKIPTKAPCQIGPATIRRYGRPNAAGRALSLGYVSHLVPLISPLYSVKSFDQNHSCIQIPAACKRRNMSTHSLYS